MMTDEIRRITDDCQTYWQEAGIPLATTKEMALELESHLRDAADNGRPARRVVGDDVAMFAREWASEYRSEYARPLPSWTQVQRRLGARPPTQMFRWATGAVVAAIAATVLLTSGKESGVDNEVWRWVWTIFAFVMGIGEIFSAGFFLLPFGIGAGFAAAAAWLGLPGAAQWVAFFGFTGVSFFYLRRFMRMQDTDQGLEIGPSRYVGMRATVLETIDMDVNTGRIRVEAEEWRAITDGPAIEAGKVVEVVELRGTRLVVTNVE